MSEKIICCKVLDEHVIGDRVTVGAAGSHDDVLIELSFSELWHGTTRQVCWFNAMGADPTIRLLTTDLLAEGETEVYRVPVPAEAKAIAGDIFMTIRGVVVGSDGAETRATMSAKAEFRVLESMWDSDAQESQDITPDQATQMQAQLDLIKENIDDAAAAAGAKEASETSAAAAAKSAAAADASANAAKDSAAYAAEAADGLYVWENYDAEKEYAVLNKVVWNGSSYVCVNPCKGILPNDADYWLMIARRGKDGDGVGDMLSEFYDPTGKEQDVYGYADGVVAEAEARVNKSLSEKPNPNLLDNWYFVNPVNQRGQTEYAETGYTFDRWYAINGGTLTGDGYKPMLNNSSRVIQQPLEDALAADIKGKTVTLSVLLKNGGLLSVTGTAPFAQDHGGIKLTIDEKVWPQNDRTVFRIWILSPSNDDTIIAAKLELGREQTLAHQDSDGNWVLNEIPNYGQELAKCQRYYQRWTGNNVNILGYISQNGAVFLGRIPLAVSLRTTPALTVSGTGFLKGVNGGAQLSSLTSLSVDSYSPKESYVALMMTNPNQELAPAGTVAAVTIDEAILALDANL